MPAESDPPRLFVYGTLMPGRLRWPILEPFAQRQRPATVAGSIYDSGNGWPVAVFGPGPALVPGVLVDLVASRVEEAWPILDEVEDTASDTLRRVCVTTTDGSTAWAYHYTRTVDTMARIERWSSQVDR